MPDGRWPPWWRGAARRARGAAAAVSGNALSRSSVAIAAGLLAGLLIGRAYQAHTLSLMVQALYTGAPGVLNARVRGTTAEHNSCTLPATPAAACATVPPPPPVAAEAPDTHTLPCPNHHTHVHTHTLRSPCARRWDFPWCCMTFQDCWRPAAAVVLACLQQLQLQQQPLEQPQEWAAAALPTCRREWVKWREQYRVCRQQLLGHAFSKARQASQAVCSSASRAQPMSDRLRPHASLPFLQHELHSCQATASTC